MSPDKAHLHKREGQRDTMAGGGTEIMDAEKWSPRQPWEGLGQGAGCDASGDESPGAVLDRLTDREGLLMAQLMAETAAHRQERLGTAHDLLGDAQGRNQRQKEGGIRVVCGARRVGK